MAYHEKKFRKWEFETFGITEVNINCLSEYQSNAFTKLLNSLPVSINVLQPGKNATKLFPNGLPGVQSIQARRSFEMKKHLEKFEQEMNEKRSNNPYSRDGVLDELLDEVLCLFHIKNATQSLFTHVLTNYKIRQ